MRGNERTEENWKKKGMREVRKKGRGKERKTYIRRKETRDGRKQIKEKASRKARKKAWAKGKKKDKRSKTENKQIMNNEIK